MIDPYLSERLPAAFVATIPPAVQYGPTDGLGPRNSPRRPSSASMAPFGAPAPAAKDEGPSISTPSSMRMSSTIPRPTAPPASPVPPPRAVTGTPRSAARRTAAATSSSSRGTAAAAGRASNGPASAA